MLSVGLLVGRVGEANIHSLSLWHITHVQFTFNCVKCALQALEISALLFPLFCHRRALMRKCSFCFSNDEVVIWNKLIYDFSSVHFAWLINTSLQLIAAYKNNSDFCRNASNDVFWHQPGTCLHTFLISFFCFVNGRKS